MAVEVACPTCGGRLMAETPGIVVECPYCHTHLQTPDDSTPESPPGIEVSAPPEGVNNPSETAVETPTEPETPADSFPSFEGIETSPVEEEPDSFPDFAAISEAPEPSVEPPTSSELPSFEIETETKTDESSSVTDSDVVTPAEITDSFTGLISDAVQVGLKPSSPPELPKEEQADSVFPGLPDSEAPAEESVFSGTLPDENETKEATQPPPIEPPKFSLEEPGATSVVSVSVGSRRSKGVPKLLFFLLMSYASAVTIALVILGTKYLRTHPLESLPDVVPKIAEDGKISFNLYPEDVEMPRGHVMQLGEMQRFGNLEVTPVKITRGPAILVNTFRNQTEEDPTEDVLKLWLHIKNVSEDQTFPPLGRRLVRTWSEQDNRANQFVCLVNQKKKDGDRVLMYELGVEDTELTLKGQQLDYVLQPGKEYNTFLATTDVQLDTLKGKLVWRVHFRKGYNPESRRGVTTLIEINFDSDEIKNEASSG